MKNIKKIGVVFSALLATAVLAAGCSSSTSSGHTDEVSTKENEIEKNVIVKIATTSDEPRVWNAVQSVLDKKGEKIKIEIVNLSGGDPNRALGEGEVDLNAFQHYAYFDQNKADLNMDLTAIGDTLIVPLNLFSVKHKSVSEIPDGGTIAIPDDATNQGRALNVLKNAGLIELDSDAGNNGLIKDISSNPKNLQFVELAGSQIPHSLEDVDAAIINCGYATDFGLDPVNDPIYKDQIDLNNPEQQPFINIIAVRTEDKNNESYLKIVEAYHSKEVADAIAEVYKNAALPAFDVPEDYVSDK